MTWNLDRSHSTIDFAVKHMIFTAFRGRFAAFEVDARIDDTDIANSSATIRVDPASFRTGIERFDGHMQSPDFFDSATYPEVTFEATRIDRKGGAKAVVAGLLTVKGITKELFLEGEIHGPLTDSFGGTRAGISVEGTIDRRDFDMGWNLPFGEGGVYLGETVRLSVDLEFVKAQS